MSTLCTQTTSSSSTNSNHCSGFVVEPVHTPTTDSVAIAMFATLTKKITRFFVTQYNRHIDRQAFKNVLTLDDRTLKDIGVTRQDVKWASRLPLSVDAAIELEQIARRR